MPTIEHVDTIARAYNDWNLEIPVDKWLRGKQASKTGFIYTESPEMFDIFGFILKSAGYRESQLVGIRVPSQFAQVQRRSGQPLSSLSGFLTTVGHADTDSCIKLGVINDDTKIDDLEREQKIATILSSHSIGVRFVDEIAQPKKMSKSALSLLIKSYVLAPDGVVSAEAYQSKLNFILKQENVGFVYGIVGNKVLLGAYYTREFPITSLIYQDVLPVGSTFLRYMTQFSTSSSTSEWFKGNTHLLNDELLRVVESTRAR